MDLMLSLRTEWTWAKFANNPDILTVASHNHIYTIQYRVLLPLISAWLTILDNFCAPFCVLLDYFTLATVAATSRCNLTLISLMTLAFSLETVVSWDT